MKKIIKKAFNLFGYDIIKMPLGSKTVKTKNLTLYKTSTGNYYLPSDANADIVVQTIKANGIFEKGGVDIAAKYIKKGTAVLDIGANFGQMSVLFSGYTGDNRKVYSFDADDFVFEILKKNIIANNEKNIMPVFGAIHNKPNEVLYFPNRI